MRSPARFLVLFAAVAVFAQGGRADVKLSIESGWGGIVRPDHWNPVFLTASDSKARPAAIDIFMPHESSLAMRVKMPLISLSIQPQVYALYLPLSTNLTDTAATLRDMGGSKIAEESFDPNALDHQSYNLKQAQISTQVLIAVSGNAPLMRSLDTEQTLPDSGQTAPMRVVFVASLRLPEMAIGYDAISLLVLNAPDFATGISSRQQLAIIDWVRSGGRLLIVPGRTPQPADAPISKILPCSIGPREPLDPITDSKVSFLPQGFKPANYTLTRKPNAQSMNILPGTPATAVYQREGLGQVAVLSLDDTVLAPIQNPQLFWNPILTQATQLSLPNTDSADTEDARRATATRNVTDKLGQIKGVGTFDFSYTAVVLLAMMFIVGPIDWFVLRKLGKPSWTWMTTTGWIALVTIGAIRIGSVLKSGDLHYNSLRLIDQVDDNVISTTDLALIYSPRTDQYELKTDPRAWWQPASLQSDRYMGPNQKTIGQIDLHESFIGTKLDPMEIRVWNLRVLRGEQIHSAGDKPALIQASLKAVRPGTAPVTLVGTITNRSEVPLDSVRVQIREGNAELLTAETSAITAMDGSPLAAGASIAPGQTVRVNAAVTVAATNMPQPVKPQYAYYGSRYGYPESAYAGPLLATAGDLVPERSRRIEQILAVDEHAACIYAQAANVSASCPLSGNKKPLEEHWRVIRALVQLTDESAAKEQSHE